MGKGMGNASQPTIKSAGRVQIAIHPEDHMKLIEIQGQMCIDEGRPVHMPEVIHEMVEKWDSLIKSYDSLKNLPEAE